VPTVPFHSIQFRSVCLRRKIHLDHFRLYHSVVPSIQLRTIEAPAPRLHKPLMLYTLPLSTAFTITTTAASIDVRGEEIRLGQLPNFAHPRLTYNNARCQDINRDYHDLHLLMWNFSSFLIAYCCISNIILPFLLHPSSPHVHIFTGLIQNLGSFPIGRALAADPPLPLAWTLMIITVISIHRNRGKTRQRVELQYVVAQVRIKQQTTECFTDVLSLLARDSDSCC